MMRKRLLMTVFVMNAMLGACALWMKLTIPTDDELQSSFNGDVDFLFAAWGPRAPEMHAGYLYAPNWAHPAAPRLASDWFLSRDFW